MTQSLSEPPSWALGVLEEWRSRRLEEHQDATDKEDSTFPLVSNGIGEEEVVAMIETVLSDRLARSLHGLRD